MLMSDFDKLFQRPADDIVIRRDGENLVIYQMWSNPRWEGPSLLESIIAEQEEEDDA